MKPASVLVLDGNPSSRETLERAIERAGHAALVARTGPEALALLSSLRPPLALVDLDGLGEEAFSLLREITLGGTDTVALAVSGVSDTARVVRAIRSGAADFLMKPVSAQALLGALTRALSQDGSAGPIEPAPRDIVEGDPSAPDLELLFGGSQQMRAVEDIVRRAADTNATILLQGESGTGKELVAKAIHHISNRRDKPFLKVNCASLPAELLESELFGHEKGAFTGAHRRKPGKFELAHRGTFLLDEIGEMPLPLQAKLLHVLQDGRFFRVGGSEVITADARLIAATNKHLATAMATGLFREDLYYRLNVVAISIPPLRERREEIPGLVDYFMDKFCRQYNRDAVKISPATMGLLQGYSWWGNVRELENMIKRAVVLQSEDLAQQEIALRSEMPRAPGPQIASPVTQSGPEILDVELGLKGIARRAAMAAEKAVMKEVLEKVKWNRAEAARLLKISYQAMLYKIRQVGLDDRHERGPGRTALTERGLASPVPINK
jgi:two-component system response regulator AtoC